MLESALTDYKVDLFRWARERNIGVVIFEPLAHGLLTNKYLPSDPPRFSEGDHRSRKIWFKKEALKVISSKLTALGERFKCRSTKDFVSLAVKYCLSRDENAVVFVGFKNKEQIAQTLSTT